MNKWLQKSRENLAARFALPAHDLLRDTTYRRLFTSIVISSFGGQVTMLALPLTAAVLLHASPTQMGLLTTMEIAPFVLFSLPAGVWLDRVRKLPVYVLGESALALVVASIPVAWWLDWLSMRWLYVGGFVIGTVYTVAGSAAQIVLTQVVARELLVEAHAKNALGTSDASASAARRFWRDLKVGVRFVSRNPLLMALALVVGVWQMCNQAASVVQILFATRILGLSEQAVGLCYTGMGLGSVVASVLGNRISQRIGPGPCLVIGFAVCGVGWLLLSVAPPNAFGVAAFALMLALVASRWAVIRNVRTLPAPENVDDTLGVEAMVRPRAVMDGT